MPYMRIIVHVMCGYMNQYKLLVAPSHPIWCNIGYMHYNQLISLKCQVQWQHQRHTLRFCLFFFFFDYLSWCDLITLSVWWFWQWDYGKLIDNHDLYANIKSLHTSIYIRWNVCLNYRQLLLHLLPMLIRHRNGFISWRVCLLLTKTACR